MTEVHFRFGAAWYVAILLMVPPLSPSVNSEGIGNYQHLQSGGESIDEEGAHNDPDSAERDASTRSRYAVLQYVERKRKLFIGRKP